MRKAFTLLEVTLAMLVMAGGILAIVSLYSLGFREQNQSNEDVAASALADQVFGRLTMALSDTNISWVAFNDIKNSPSDGWEGYFDGNGNVISGTRSVAEAAFHEVMTHCGQSGVASGFPSMPADGCVTACGLVVTHKKDEPVVHLSFRAARRESLLISSPLYYMAIRFQGKVDSVGGNAP